MHLNNKISIIYGPIVLTSDERLNENNNVIFDKNEKIIIKNQKNKTFNSNICFLIKNKKHRYYFVDYAQAGKNFDDEKSRISVWFETK